MKWQKSHTHTYTCKRGKWIEQSFRWVAVMYEIPKCVCVGPCVCVVNGKENISCMHILSFSTNMSTYIYISHTNSTERKVLNVYILRQVVYGRHPPEPSWYCGRLMSVFTCFCLQECCVITAILNYMSRYIWLTRLGIEQGSMFDELDYQSSQVRCTCLVSIKSLSFRVDCLEDPIVILLSDAFKVFLFCPKAWGIDPSWLICFKGLKLPTNLPCRNYCLFHDVISQILFESARLGFKAIVFDALL